MPDNAGLSWSVLVCQSSYPSPCQPPRRPPCQPPDLHVHHPIKFVQYGLVWKALNPKQSLNYAQQSVIEVGIPWCEIMWASWSVTQSASSTWIWWTQRGRWRSRDGRTEGPGVRLSLFRSLFVTTTAPCIRVGSNNFCDYDYDSCHIFLQWQQKWSWQHVYWKLSLVSSAWQSHHCNWRSDLRFILRSCHKIRIISTTL